MKRATQLRLSHICRTTILCWLLAALPAAAGTLTGTVRNATTNSPAANVDVILINLASGMDAVGTFKADAQGRFSITHPAIGQGQILIRVQHRGVNYHASLPPNQTTASLDIYDVTAKSKDVEVANRIFLIQPEGASLLIGEQYIISNRTSPRVAVFEQKGNFEFAIPEGGTLVQVSASGPGAMPLVQGTIDRGKNRYAIAYPFRPGDTTVRVSYQVPYSNNAATLRSTSPLAAKSVLIAAPPAMTVAADGFEAGGNEGGLNIYARQNVAANAPLTIKVSGAAPPGDPAPAAGGGNPMGAGGGGNPMAGGAPRDAGAESAAGVQVVPMRLRNIQWVLVAGLSLMFAAGIFFLSRRPLPADVQSAPAMASAPSMTREAERGAAPSAPAPGGDAAAQVMAGIAGDAKRRLDAVKDQLFRLELRHQAGAIGEDEYARERAAAEKALRELLGSD